MDGQRVGAWTVAIAGGGVLAGNLLRLRAGETAALVGIAFATLGVAAAVAVAIEWARVTAASRVVPGAVVCLLAGAGIGVGLGVTGPAGTVAVVASVLGGLGGAGVLYAAVGESAVRDGRERREV